MADKIVNRNGVMRKVVSKGTQQQQMKKTTKLCVEGSGNNKKLVLLRDGLKDCIPFSERPSSGGSFTCGDVENCSVIVQIQTDITNIENDIDNINIAITNLQEATTVEAMQDAVAPLLAHGDHNGLTAFYDDANNKIILTVTGGGGSFTCADVATCIDSNSTTQTALLNWLQNLSNVTLQGTWNFEGDVNFTDNTVTFDNSTVNLTNNSVMNYDSTTISNHNGDTINYDGSTVNSNDTTYNHTNDTFNISNSTINSTHNTYNHIDDTINYDIDTEINGGTFNNNTFNNPTFTGTIGVGIKRVNEPIVGGPAGIFTLGHIPMGDIQLSVLGGVIQIETGDYTHVDSSNTFTTNIDTTGLTLIATYIIGSSLPAPTPVQANWQETNTLSPSFVQNKVVRPDQLGGTTSNGKIVVRNTNGTFRDATAADITSLGVGGLTGSPVIIPTSGLVGPNSTSTPIQLSGAGLIRYNIVSWSGDNRGLYIEISQDNITYTTINFEGQPFTSANSAFCRRIMVEPNQYIRFRYITDGGGSANVVADFIPL